MAGLSLSLLGPLRVTLHGAPVTSFAYNKVLALLVFLAAEGDRPHRREALAGLLWPDQEGRAARHSLSQALWSLRRTLDGHGSSADDHRPSAALLLSREAVRLPPAGDNWIDVAAFTALLDACDRHVHQSRASCSWCARRLERAAALYQGDFLAEFSLPDSAMFEEWAVAKRGWLRQRASRTLAQLSEYQQRRGALDRARQITERRLALDPWDEEAHRQLLHILALDGQRGLAMAEHARFRRALAEELHCAPAEATTALYRQIQQGLLTPRSPAVECPDVRTPRSNLPAGRGPLIGREDDLRRLASLLADPTRRLITLVGPGGIGKTRLGLEAATAAREAFVDGAWFVALAPLNSPRLLVPAIANALQVTLHGQEEAQAQLLAALRDRELLLVLDNFEHLIEGAVFIGEVLQHAPEVTVLVTSREPLRLSEEWVFSVEGLGVPGNDDVASIEDFGAVRMFAHSARKVQADFALRPADRASVARICRLVGGMPLGLELAAAWIPVLSCQAIADEIGRNLDFLSTTLRDLPERHRNMRAVFDHSWRLLTAEQRAVFAKLAVFRGGFERAAVEAVAQTSLFGLSALVSKSLVRKTSADRYEIHELLRQYAEDQLEANPDEARQAQQRHCDYYLAFLAQREGSLKGAAQLATLREVAAEQENVRAAWHWATAHRQTDRIARAADGYWLFWTGSGRIWEGEQAFGGTVMALKESLGHRPKEDPIDQIALGKALARQGSYCFRLGSYEQALALLRESVGLFRRLAVTRELGFSLNLLASVIHLQGNYAEERRLLLESIALLDAAGDHWAAAYSLNDLAMATYLLDDIAEAQRLSRESLAQFQRIGDRRGIAFALNNLGEFAAALGAYADAERLHRESLKLRRAAGDEWGIAASLFQLGFVTRLAGADRDARRRQLEALQVANACRALPLILAILLELAVLMAHDGAYEQAVEVLALTGGHPARPRFVQDNVERFRRQLDRELSPSVVATIQRSITVRSVEDVVRSLLRNAASETLATASVPSGSA